MKIIKIQLWIFLLICLSVNISLGDNIVEVRSAEVNAGQVVEVEIIVENDSSIVAFQVDIPMHEELSFLNDSIWLNTSRTNANHTLADTILPGDTLRILIYSTNNTAFTGDTGVLLSFKMRARNDPGDYVMQLNNTILGNDSSVNVLSSAVNGTVTIKAPDIHFSASQLDFGETPLTSHTDRSITIYNQGNLPLDISDISFGSTWFALTNGSSFTIGAGSSVNKTVRFSASEKGDFDIDMTVTSNDPDESSASVNCIANAYAVNELHTGNMSGYSQDTLNLAFSINNMEPFNGFQFDLNMPSPLTFISDSIHLSTRKSDHVVSANVLSGNKLRVVAYSPNNEFFTCTDGEIVNMDFYVEGTGGYYSLNLSDVVIGDSNGLNAMSDYSNGQLQIAAADIHCNSSVAFGDVSTLGSGEKNLTIYNYGNDTLEISNLVLSNHHFIHNKILPLLINPGENDAINLRFASTTEGPASGTLRIFSNDPDENPVTVNLTANAFIPNYMLVKDTSFILGDTAYIDILVENVESFTGFQIDLKTSAEFQCVLDSIQLSDRKTDHLVHASVIDSAENKIRIFAFSMSQTEFSGTQGSVVTIPFVLDTLLAGIYNIDITNALLGDQQSEDILYSYSDGQAEASEGVPRYYNPGNTNINSGDTSCFNASNTITVAGDDNQVNVFSGGHATFIAGNKIRFLPGFKSYEGSYSHAYITLTESFCSNTESMLSAPEEEEPDINLTDEHDNYVLYPNPNNGCFTIKFENEFHSAMISLFSLRGIKLFTREYHENNTITIESKNLRSGIYLISISLDGNLIKSKISVY